MLYGVGMQPVGNWDRSQLDVLNSSLLRLSHKPSNAVSRRQSGSHLPRLPLHCMLLTLGQVQAAWCQPRRQLLGGNDNRLQLVVADSLYDVRF